VEALLAVVLTGLAGWFRWTRWTRWRGLARARLAVDLRSEALAKVALEAPGRKVRMAAAQDLVQQHPDDPETARVLTALAGDVDGEVRLWALRQREGIEGLAETVRTPALAGRWRAEALRLLDERVGQEGAAPLVRLALNVREPALVEAATELIRMAGPDVDPRVHAALRASLDGSVGPALVWKLIALGSCGETEDLGRLHGFLDHGDAEVEQAAARGRATLLQRLQPGEGGSLAVVEPGDEGGLSLTDAQETAGRLSETD
jgi:hypothetical protein